MKPTLNQLHGSSVITFINDSDVEKILTEKMKDVDHTEITYCATEVFADGYVTHNVYFLAADPDAPPPVVSKRPTAKVPPVALVKRFVL